VDGGWGERWVRKKERKKKSEKKRKEESDGRCVILERRRGRSR
jgi:hypothetical protein